MKKINVFLLGTLLSQWTFAQSGNRYLYSYDNAGNIISRFITFLRGGQNDMSNNDTMDNYREEDSFVTIRTDALWSDVQIEISGDITSGDMLSIYTSEGFFVMSFRIESHRFSLNLSTFRKGTYLFRFKLNKKTFKKKLIKQN